MPVLFAAHHEAVLACVFNPDEAVDDVDAGLLELRGPRRCCAASSKRAFTSTSAATCLPRLGGLDERRDHRGVVGGAIERLFDGEHLRGRPPPGR